MLQNQTITSLMSGRIGLAFAQLLLDLKMPRICTVAPRFKNAPTFIKSATLVNVVAHILLE